MSSAIWDVRSGGGGYLGDEGDSLFLELGALVFDDLDEKLFLQTDFRDGEVQQRHFDGDFRQVMRVGQLGGHEELEIRVINYLVLAKLHEQRGALFLGVLLQDRLKEGVQGFLNVLEEAGRPETDAALQCSLVVLI